MAFIYPGDDLLSHTLSRAVQSARRGLTSVFGMGTGGTPAVRSPTTCSCQLPAVSSQQLCAGADFRLTLQQAFKEREGNASQLNRLGANYLLTRVSSCYFGFSSARSSLLNYQLLLRF